MISTDPIADMLSRIRNAISVRKEFVYVPYSKLKLTILTELQAQGYIYKVQAEGEGNDKNLVVTLSLPGQNALISEIHRVSTPGRRVYAQVDNIPLIKSGRGEVILSTSKGIMTGKAARKSRLGGEVICRVY